MEIAFRNENLNLACKSLNNVNFVILFSGSVYLPNTYNTELNDLRIIICLRKSEVFVEKNI